MFGAMTEIIGKGAVQRVIDELRATENVNSPAIQGTHFSEYAQWNDSYSWESKVAPRKEYGAY